MYRRQQIALTIFCVIALTATLACDKSGGKAGASGDTTVAATVNGKKIMTSEVDRLLNQQTGGQQLSDLELAQARLQILEKLIQQEVLFQRAEKEKVLPSDDEVNQALATLKQQGNLTQEEYERRLQESGQTEQSLREEVRRQLALEKLQNKTVANVGTAREKEVDSFYEANKEQFVRRRGLSLAAIVIDPRDNGARDDAKTEADAAAKAGTIYQRIKSGADFATVARARSEDASNARGGDLGFVPEEQLRQGGFPPELVARFFSMNVGDVTQPILVGGRLTIFKLQGKQEQNENLTREDPQVRDQIKQALINERKSLLNAVMIEIAMNEADIKNNIAQNVMNNPGSLTGMRPAGAESSASPATNASPAASASGSATASPAASPAASPSR